MGVRLLARVNPPHSCSPLGLVELPCLPRRKRVILPRNGISAAKPVCYTGVKSMSLRDALCALSNSSC